MMHDGCSSILRSLDSTFDTRHSASACSKFLRPHQPSPPRSVSPLPAALPNAPNAPDAPNRQPRTADSGLLFRFIWHTSCVMQLFVCLMFVV